MVANITINNGFRRKYRTGLMPCYLKQPKKVVKEYCLKNIFAELKKFCIFATQFIRKVNKTYKNIAPDSPAHPHFAVYGRCSDGALFFLG